MSTSLDEDQTAAKLIFRGLAQSVKQMQFLTLPSATYVFATQP